MRTITHLIIHCTATRADRPLTVDALRAAHRSRGFRDVGYHFYVRRDGTVHQTRPLAQVGAHALGFNAHSLGLAYEGGLDTAGRPCDTRTPEQRTALRALAARLLRRFPAARLCGHRDLSPDLNGNGTIEPHEWQKQCPCFNVATEF